MLHDLETQEEENSVIRIIAFIFWSYLLPKEMFDKYVFTRNIVCTCTLAVSWKDAVFV